MSDWRRAIGLALVVIAGAALVGAEPGWSATLAGALVAVGALLLFPEDRDD